MATEKTNYDTVPKGSSGVTAKIENCIAYKDKILQLFFQEKVKSDDVAELIQTAQKVDAILKKIEKQQFSQINPNSLSLKIFQRTLDKLELICVDYHAELVKIDQSGQLPKVLSNTNQRKKIEQFNSLFLVEATNLEEKTEYLIKEIKNFSSSSSGVRDIPEAARTRTVTGNNNLEIIPINDPEARDLWASNFQTKLQVEWKPFIKMLTDYLNSPMSEDEKKALKHILDNSNTGYVTAYKFSEFLRGFGNLQNCFQNVFAILKEKWFYGFLSMEEAKKFLEPITVGTYLVRFSSSKPGSFALAFTSSPSKVTHVIITTSPQGFTIKDQAGEKSFKNLNEIIEFYGTFLKIPFDSTLPKDPFFFGDLSAQEAEEYLIGKKTGTYLIRFSSNPGYFAASYVDKNGQIAKTLIAGLPDFYLVDNNGSHYGHFTSMRELVQSVKDIFKYPYKNTSNEVNESQRKKIATELYETEKSYVKHLDVCYQIFMQPLQDKSKSIITVDEFDQLFSNLTEIKEIHDNFLNELTTLKQDWADEIVIGDALLKLDSKLKAYVQYINNYNFALEMLNRLSKNDKFKKFLETCSQNPMCQLNQLTAYLIQPIQRVPRYILLLSDLQKHTSDSHSDFEDLSKALERIKDTADYLNECKRLTDRVSQIEQSLVGEFEKLTIKNRSFVREGSLGEKVKGARKERYFYLFNDILLHTEPKKDNKYSFKSVSKLYKASVYEMLDTSNDKYGFKIGLTDGNEVTLYCNSENEKLSWMRDIKTVIDSIAAEEIKNPKSSGSMLRTNMPIIISRQNTVDKLVEKPVMSPSMSASMNRLNLLGSYRTSQETLTGLETAIGELWKEAYTADGNKYYYNTKTKETSWTKPV